MVQIAGGIVWNPERGVIVVNQHHNSWSLPKGHVEEGESHLDAAIREIEEETGLSRDTFTLIRPLGSYQRARISRDGKSEEAEAMRELHMFFFRTQQHDALTPSDPENPEARWVPVDDVADLLTHPKDKEFFMKHQKELFTLDK